MKTAVLFLPFCLAACAPNLEGSYRTEQGEPAFRLSHGKYYRANPDGSDYKAPRPGLPPLPRALPYKVDGRVLLVEAAPTGTAFDILPDGRLKLSEQGHALIFVRK